MAPHASPGRLAIPAKKKKKKPAVPAPPPKLTTRNPEVKAVGRELAEIALIRVGQGGRLNVRQKEQLRRALAKAGILLRWAATVVGVKDPIAEVSKDVAKICKNGAQTLTSDLEDELDRKKAEIKELEKTIAQARKTAASKKTEFPAEVTFTRTAREAASGLVTKTETVTFEEASEMETWADKTENTVDRWTGLRDQMVVELKGKKSELAEVKKTLGEFVKWLQPLLSEVLATLE